MKNIIQNRRGFLKLAGGAASLSMIPGTVLAQVADAEQIAHRINMADEMSMYCQRVAKAVALIRLGVDKEIDLAQMQDAHDKYDDILVGFQTGGGSSGITKERAVKVQIALREAETLWQPMRVAIEEIIAAGDVDDEHFELIATANISLKDKCHGVVLALEQFYGGTSIDPAYALAMEIAGRQRMLTQEMSKELALIALGYKVEQNHEYFKASSALFSMTLDILINGGMDGIQLIKPPTSKAMEDLKNVQARWMNMQGAVEAINNGLDPDVEMVADFAHQSEDLLAIAEHAVMEYEHSAIV